jgi:phage shock protein E
MSIKAKVLIAAALVLFGAALPFSFELLSKSNAEERKPVVANPAIDMEGYLKVSQEAAKHRATRRLTEEDFIKMASESGTIVLDCRSAEKYKLMHIKGAINLSFPDITIESLKKAIPDKESRVLIYCNNNFRNSERAFPSKLPTASLNLSTYIALYNYGYRNVYELAPLVDPKTSKLTFETAPTRTEN